MAYTKDQMVYKDKYKWTAKSDKDNPNVRHGKEAKELNRSEGYEMRDFINSLADSWKWKDKPVSLYNNLERIIINEVPRDIHKHDEIKKWIEQKYNVFK
ncbi:hypothetical protein [Chryseobacterium cheonjiense]|uniref:Uncharacterized protein n=1 Tax=Chryseobacterium cheonjiense TaxID=2728845 RepID=A0A7Y0A4W8_9FLAO|nr:hypothetical protein [Chryseobacterium cheonjiense]NML56767.1 hypothetical protein [Chryseobacterium cheonjiense]